MATRDTARCLGQQEVKSPRESSTRSDSSAFLDAPERPDIKPCPLAGQKRSRSLSPLGTVRKRRSLAAEPFHDPKPLESVVPKANWHCPNCGLPCWRCYSPPKAPVDHNRARQNDDSEPESMASEPRSAPPSIPPSTISSTASSKKRKKCEENGVKYVSPRDPEFKGRILAPCGLVLGLRTPTDLEPARIFDPQTLSTSSRVFVHKDQKEMLQIIEDFEEYIARGYDENALTTICQDSIILRDRFIYNDLFGDKCTITSVRRDKWKPHKLGPPIPKGAYTYDWDIEPDATYAISINMFSAENRRELQNSTWLPWLGEENAVCPYLTIEYKCSEKTGKNSHATHQTAAASMLWLYQQKQICDALNLPLDNLRHYLITIFDANYLISEARFKDNSYYIHSLATGLLTRLDDLKRYMEWSNAIHTWGLGPHASTFKSNIETLISRSRRPPPPFL